MFNDAFDGDVGADADDYYRRLLLSPFLAKRIRAAPSSDTASFRGPSYSLPCRPGSFFVLVYSFCEILVLFTDFLSFPVPSASLPNPESRLLDIDFCIPL